MKKMRSVRVGLVANTKSGAADRAAHVERLLRDAGADAVVFDLAQVCHEPDALMGKLEGLDRIVAAGGDGTVGWVASFARRAGLPLAVLPIGTANSFARWLGLPLDVGDAARLAASASAPTRAVEVAHADGMPFVNVAATGLSVLAAHRARGLKRRLGPLAYAVGAARAAIGGSPLHTVVVCDGSEVWRGDAWQVLVAATGAFGGESSTGGVDTDDHRLDVAIVEAGPRLALLRRGFAMRRGRLVDQEAVRHVRGAVVELEIDGMDSGVWFNVDGEVLDLGELYFAILGQVEVVVPT
jgi:diacylglycerol kinase family enzyme